MINSSRFAYSINSGKESIAIVFMRSKRPKGLCFPTPESNPLQIGWHTQDKERVVPLHKHPHIKYKVELTHEFLYVEKGWMRIELTDSNWKPLKKLTLKSGDSILITGGGHKVTIGPKTSILEIKQGPYPGEKKSKIYK